MFATFPAAGLMACLLSGLTKQVYSKVVLCDVFKQSGEDGEQRHSSVVDVL